MISLNYIVTKRTSIFYTERITELCFGNIIIFTMMQKYLKI